MTELILQNLPVYFGNLPKCHLELIFKRFVKIRFHFWINFQNSIDRADEDIDESRKPFIKKVEISPFTQNLAPLTPLAPPTIAPNVPSHTGAPLAYRFPRASSPQDSEYYSEYYESCMETPTGSPIG